MSVQSSYEKSVTISFLQTLHKTSKPSIFVQYNITQLFGITKYICIYIYRYVHVLKKKPVQPFLKVHPSIYCTTFRIY